MDEVIYNLSKLLPYIIVFPFMALLLLFLHLIFRKGVNNNNISLYGLFLSLNNKDIVSFSLIFIQFIVILETMFLNGFTSYSLLFIFTPILIYGIINLDIVNMILNFLATAFLVVLCFLEQVFLSYLIDVNYVWYVLILFVSTCLFIVAFDVFILGKNINVLTKKRIDKAKKLGILEVNYEKS